LYRNKEGHTKTFQTRWKENIFNDCRKCRTQGNKLRTYRKFKTSFGLEPYLTCVKEKHIRSEYCKFRLSAHKLNIEMGRYVMHPRRLLPEERICNLCNNNQMEDEIHFLLLCPSYEEKRKDLIAKIILTFPCFASLNTHDQFVCLLSTLDVEIINLVANFVFNCVKSRSELLKNS
jgi:hypothetical protein